MSCKGACRNLVEFLTLLSFCGGSSAADLLLTCCGVAADCVVYGAAARGQLVPPSQVRRLPRLVPGRPACSLIPSTGGLRRNTTHQVPLSQHKSFHYDHPDSRRLLSPPEHHPKERVHWRCLHMRAAVCSRGPPLERRTPDRGMWSPKASCTRAGACGVGEGAARGRVKS